MKLKYLVVLLVSLSVAQGVSAASEADKIVGVYSAIRAGEESKVRITRNEAGKYDAQIFWVKQPRTADGKVKCDVKNPDPQLRSVPADKIVLMKNLTYVPADNNYVGEVYDPTRGKIFKCVVRFKSATRLEVRGYIGNPFFGESMHWDKIE